MKNRAPYLLLAVTLLAAAAPEPLPRVGEPVIKSAVEIISSPRVQSTSLQFIEIDRAGEIKLFGYTLNADHGTSPVILFTRQKNWMAAIYDGPTSDLNGDGFWFAGRLGGGFVAVWDNEVEGADHVLRVMRSADGVRWRPVGVLRKESFTQLFQELQVFDGGRWMISISGSQEAEGNSDSVYQSTNAGRSWRLARRVPPLPDGWETMHHYFSPQVAGRGGRVTPSVRLSWGEIKSSRFVPEP